MPHCKQSDPPNDAMTGSSSCSIRPVAAGKFLQ